MSETKRMVLRAWNDIGKKPLPLDGLDPIEVEVSNGPNRNISYDPDWGKGRGCWFNDKNQAFNVSKVIRWRRAGA